MWLAPPSCAPLASLAPRLTCCAPVCGVGHVRFALLCARGPPQVGAAMPDARVWRYKSPADLAAAGAKPVGGDGDGDALRLTSLHDPAGDRPLVLNCEWCAVGAVLLQRTLARGEVGWRVMWVPRPVLLVLSCCCARQLAGCGSFGACQERRPRCGAPCVISPAFACVPRCYAGLRMQHALV